MFTIRLAAALSIVLGLSSLVVTHQAPADQSQAPVVMMTEVFVCGDYRGSFLVTADGHWIYETVDTWPKKDADLALAKLPKYAQAYLDPTRARSRLDLGDCPPSVSTHTHLEEP